MIKKNKKHLSRRKYYRAQRAMYFMVKTFALGWSFEGNTTITTRLHVFQTKNNNFYHTLAKIKNTLEWDTFSRERFFIYHLYQGNYM